MPLKSNIRPLKRGAHAEVELVAKNMRSTLLEVLSAEEYDSQYTDEWLLDRLQQHLDGRLQAEVLVAEVGGDVVGHIILRIEESPQGRYGLFSTFYVSPEFRRRAVGVSLLCEGEVWMADQGLERAITYTSDRNDKLIQMLKKHDYKISNEYPDKHMIGLSKRLVIK